MHLGIEKLSAAAERKRNVKTRIQHIYEDSKQNHGGPEITKVLQKERETISERTVGKYMKEMGIEARWIRPWTVTTRDSGFSNKLQNILNERPNAVWCSDITYI